jgi:hypothetical protein
VVEQVAGLYVAGLYVASLAKLLPGSHILWGWGEAA